MKVNGKVLVVTGAGNGMGREVALELLRRGAKVAGLDLKPEWLAETKNLAGENAHNFFGYECNISDRNWVLTMPEKIQGEVGAVDALVNVAGIIQPFVKINDLDFEHIDRVMHVNLYGPINLIKAFLPGLLSRPEAHILNVSSMGSYAPVPGQTMYGATKAALNMFTEGLRSELKETNVALTLVWPGAIGTNISANSGVKFGSGELTEAQKKAAAKVTSPVLAGKMMVDAIESKAPRIYIGSDAATMGFLTRLSPDFAANLIYKNMKSLLG
jgi:NAD(P)-dependent dehydrogenase (short-subunit alcohol dehydrogenase family)